MSKCYHHTLFLLTSQQLYISSTKVFTDYEGKATTTTKNIRVQIVCHITIHVHADILQQPSIENYRELKRVVFSGREISKQGIYSRKSFLNYLPIHYTTMMQKVKTSKITDYLHLLNFAVYFLQNWALFGNLSAGVSIRQICEKTATADDAQYIKTKTTARCRLINLRSGCEWWLNAKIKDLNMQFSVMALSVLRYFQPHNGVIVYPFAKEIIIWQDISLQL